MQKVQNIVTRTAKFVSRVFSSKTSSSQDKKGNLFTYTVHCVHEIKTNHLLPRRTYNYSWYEDQIRISPESLIKNDIVDHGLNSLRDALCDRERPTRCTSPGTCSVLALKVSYPRNPLRPRQTEMVGHLICKLKVQLIWAKVLKNCVSLKLSWERLSITHQVEYRATSYQQSQFDL